MFSYVHDIKHSFIISGFYSSNYPLAKWITVVLNECFGLC